MKYGYPEEHELETIENWCHTDGFDNLMKYVHERWHWKEFITCTKELSQITYDCLTGGWSGNEELIGALERNQVFWAFCWYQSTRGGHYIFKV